MTQIPPWPGGTNDSNSLPRNQVPEWAAFYINYKGLKKLIKAIAAAVQNGEQVDVAGVFPSAFHLTRWKPFCCEAQKALKI